VTELVIWIPDGNPFAKASRRYALGELRHLFEGIESFPSYAVTGKSCGDERGRQN
jgi:hypothetical protein